MPEAGHHLSVLYYQSTFNPVHCQLQFIPFLDFLTNSYRDWEDKECWLSSLPWLFRSYTGNLYVDLWETASQPVQHTSESLQVSPEVWQKGQRPALQLPEPRPCKGEAGPILEELSRASSLAYTGFSAIPERLMQTPQDFPPCSGYLPPGHSSPGGNRGCLWEREGHRKWQSGGRNPGGLHSQLGGWRRGWP